jgi:hypothetical protein
MAEYLQLHHQGGTSYLVTDLPYPLRLIERSYEVYNMPR